MSIFQKLMKWKRLGTKPIVSTLEMSLACWTYFLSIPQCYQHSAITWLVQCQHNWQKPKNKLEILKLFFNKVRQMTHIAKGVLFIRDIDDRDACLWHVSIQGVGWGQGAAFLCDFCPILSLISTERALLDVFLSLRHKHTHTHTHTH